MPKRKPPTTSSPRRRRGPRGDITRADIVAAATRVLDSGSLGAVTTRAVAAAAGVSPNALYTYVDDMDDLLNAVGDQFLGTVDLTALETDDARAGLRRLVADVWCRCRRRPGMGRLLASRRIVGPHALALNEALLDRLVRAGLPSPRAADAVYALTAYLYGHLICGVPDSADATIDKTLAGLDPSDYPLTFGVEPAEPRVGHTAAGGVADPDEHLDLTGLDIVLDGVFALR